MYNSFLKVAAASFNVSNALPSANAQKALLKIDAARQSGVQVLVFPELCLTGACCGTLYEHQALLSSATEALFSLAQLTCDLSMLILLGLPVRLGNDVTSCMAAIQHGRLLALIPKKHHDGLPGAVMAGVPTGDLPLSINGVSARVLFGAERPQGAQLLLYPSSLAASCKSQPAVKSLFESARGCACVYASNAGDSVTDYCFDGTCAVFEDGKLLGIDDGYDGALVVCDVDTAVLNVNSCPGSLQVEIPNLKSVRRKLSRTPWFESPWSGATSDFQCARLFELQARAIAKRAQDIGAKGLLLGFSGGLDSTIALLACAEAAKILGQPNDFVHAAMLPGYGSSGKTTANAAILSRLLGVSARSIDIRPGCEALFSSLNRGSEPHDTTFENAQARERTQILFSIANSEGLLGIGTSDLSEIALGFSTFGGDHLAFYNVNSSLLKTQLQQMLRYYAKKNKTLSHVLLSILETPISPELLPPEQGEISQKSELIIGPYDLQDFFLYYLLKYSLSPQMLLERARLAFPKYSKAFIAERLKLLLTRFFANQFKRNCSPEGAAVTEFSLSPRIFAMPSDAFSDAWLRELD